MKCVEVISGVLKIILGLYLALSLKVNGENMQAILILAHKNIEQIIQLTNLLSKQFEVYVHIDKKCPMDLFFIQKLSGNPHVHIFKKFDVHWGGFSIAEAELFLLREAIKNPDITYFHIISGQDWPVIPLKEIYRFYESTDSIYMTYRKSKEVVKSNEPIIMWQKYYFDYDQMNRKSLWGKLYHRWTIMYQTLRKVDKFKDLGIEYDIYQGSNWCDLPRYAVDYLLKYIQNHRNYLTMLKTGFCSDEVLCQTALCNSPYSNKIVNNNHRYILWKKQYKNYPAIIDEREFDKIKSGRYHFARKIDITLSKKLLELLDVME